MFISISVNTKYNKIDFIFKVKQSTRNLIEYNIILLDNQGVIIQAVLEKKCLVELFFPRSVSMTQIKAIHCNVHY